MTLKRGFSHIDKRIEDKGANSFCSCKSCHFDDSEDGCTNTNVTKFDIVDDGQRIYCSYWKLSK